MDESHGRSHIGRLATSDKFDYLDSPSHFGGLPDTQSFVAQDLPTLNLFAKILKGFTGEPFGEIIGKLFGGSNLKNLNVSISNVMPEVVPLDMEVLGGGRDALVRREN